MGDISSINLNNTLYNIKDNTARINIESISTLLNSIVVNSVIPISKGGTGATTATNAWTNLGGGSIGKLNSLSISNIPDLSSEYSLTTHTHNYLPLTGGTLDGSINLRNQNISITTNHSSSLGRAINFYDKDDQRIGSIQAIHTKNMASQVYIAASNIPSDTTNVITNTLNLYVHNDGSKTVYVSNPEAWQAGLSVYSKTEVDTALSGKANSSHNHSASDINSGTLPIARGGTGATTAALAWTALGGGASGKHADDYFALASHTHSYLPLSGGTLTGSLSIEKSSSLYLYFNNTSIISGSTPSGSEYYIGTISFRDNEEHSMGFIRSSYLGETHSSNPGGSRIIIQNQRRKNATTTNVYNNYLIIGNYADGSAYISLSNPTAWRKELELGTNGTFPITIAQGGTGATNATTAIKNFTSDPIQSDATSFLTITSNWARVGYTNVANVKTVLGLKSAAYTESSAYATASHNHSASDITSGTLPITRGGTGQTTTTNAANALLMSLEDGSAGYVSPRSLKIIAEASGANKFVKRTIEDFYKSMTAADVPDLSATYSTVGHTHNYLPLSGGTLTGVLSLKNTLSFTVPGSDKTATSLSSEATRYITYYDDNNARLGRIVMSQSETGTSQLLLTAYHTNSSGTEVAHTLGIRVYSDGSRNIYMTSAIPWRMALGLGTDGSLPITIAQGGTGATNTTTAVYNLFNSNVSTSTTHFLTFGYYNSKWEKVGYTNIANVKTVLGLKSAAYTESSDYATSSHTHAAGDINSGSLPIKYGGTGATNTTTAIKNLTNDNIGTSSQYFLTITSGWARTGYATIANARSVLGVYTTTEVDTKLSNKSDSDHTHSYLPLSGGTLTGNINMKHTSMDVTGTPSSVYGRYIYFVDKNNTTMGNISMYQYKTTGEFGITMNTTRSVNETSISHTLRLCIASDGTRRVVLSDGANTVWRDALDVYSKSEIDTKLSDSGWLTATPLQTSSTNRYSGSILYRKVWKTVEVIANNIKLTNNLSQGTNINLTTIGTAGYTPSYTILGIGGFVSTSTGKSFSLFTISMNNAGTINIVAVPEAISNAQFISFHLIYTVA